MQSNPIVSMGGLIDLLIYVSTAIILAIVVVVVNHSKDCLIVVPMP